MAAAAESHLRSGQRKTWLERIDADADNLRAVFRWCQAAGQIETELQLISMLTWYWYFRGHIREAHERVISVIKRAPPPP